MSNLICNRREDIDSLLLYVDKPVYVNGICWNRRFDGWVVIYDAGESWISMNTLVIDYRGKTYPVRGFLPSKYTMQYDSSINNAFYKTKEVSTMNEH